ncbi:hypothetical protein, partial [Streptomyces longispororuber]|uniref:hypothetical protein n=1 Tax=Streptomyces longispororuber TaxID=68230 RepID=UPI00210B4B1F
RRRLTWLVSAVAVLALTGWFAEPYARDYLVARDVCDGSVAGDTVDRLTPDGAHLDHSEGKAYAGLGVYTCVLEVAADDEHDDAWGLFALSASTRRDDRDRLYRETFDDAHDEGSEAYALLPGGLPGFVDSTRRVLLRVPCPALGEDPDGQPRQLTTVGGFSEDALTGVPGAAYRSAVEFTNSASKELGCGAEPLRVRGAAARATLPDPGRDDTAEEKVTAQGAATSPCGRLVAGWLSEPSGTSASSGRSEPGTWTTSGQLGGAAAPLGSCELSSPVPGSEDDQWFTLRAWYGSWSNRFVVDDDRNGRRLPMTATVRCADGTANFRLGTSRVPSRVKIDRADQRRLLRLFVTDQVRRHGGCAGEPRFTF